MNTAYNYKNGNNNTNSYNVNSKKGTVARTTYSEPMYPEFADKYLSFIDMIIDALSSFHVLVAAKAIFAFIALLGFFGVIGGIELGTVSLFTGVIALALIVVTEFIILKD